MSKENKSTNALANVLKSGALPAAQYNKSMLFRDINYVSFTRDNIGKAVFYVDSIEKEENLKDVSWHIVGAEYYHGYWGEYGSDQGFTESTEKEAKENGGGEGVRCALVAVVEKKSSKEFVLCRGDFFKALALTPKKMLTRIDAIAEKLNSPEEKAVAYLLRKFEFNTISKKSQGGNKYLLIDKKSFIEEATDEKEIMELVKFLQENEDKVNELLKSIKGG